MITLPEYFSYSGTTAVFLAFSFIPIVYIHYEIDSTKNRVQLKAYMKTMDTAFEKNLTPGQVLKETKKNQKRSMFL